MIGLAPAPDFPKLLIWDNYLNKFQAYLMALSVKQLHKHLQSYNFLQLPKHLEYLYDLGNHFWCQLYECIAYHFRQFYIFCRYQMLPLTHYLNLLFLNKLYHYSNQDFVFQQPKEILYSYSTQNSEFHHQFLLKNHLLLLKLKILI